jgi:hypothetical protein
MDMSVSMGIICSRNHCWSKKKVQIHLPDLVQIQVVKVTISSEVVGPQQVYEMEISANMVPVTL